MDTPAPNQISPLLKVLVFLFSIYMTFLYSKKRVPAGPDKTSRQHKLKELNIAEILAHIGYGKTVIHRTTPFSQIQMCPQCAGNVLLSSVYGFFQ